MLSIDHAVLAVGDLDEAGGRILRTYGLASVPGGVHPRWGTANRIIPLGRDYLELIAVVDPAVADTTAFGRTLQALTADGRDHWAELCVADTDVDATAARLGLEVEAGLRTTPDGREIRWHGAGLEEDVRRPYLPFFITWDVHRRPDARTDGGRPPDAGERDRARRGRRRRRGPGCLARRRRPAHRRRRRPRGDHGGDVVAR